MLVFLILLTNHELKILTSYSISAVLMTLKTPFLSRLFSSFHWDSANKGNIFSKASILSYRKIDILVVFCWNCASSRCVCSVLRHSSIDLSYIPLINLFCSSLIDLLGLSLSSDLGLSSRYNLTTIVLKLVEDYLEVVSYMSLP